MRNSLSVNDGEFGYIVNQNPLSLDHLNVVEGFEFRGRADWTLVAETSFWYMECDLSGREGARVSAGL